MVAVKREREGDSALLRHALAEIFFFFLGLLLLLAAADRVADHHLLLRTGTAEWSTRRAIRLTNLSSNTSRF